MIDADGFRANVGIILTRSDRKVFWAQRLGQEAWQFPQGGIQEGETPEQAMYRELDEEVGLSQQQVEIVACTDGWLRYRLPKRYIRRNSKPRCIGQKQVWFLLRFTGSEQDIDLETSDTPEFCGWQWVDYWHPLEDVIFFKRNVYQKALREFVSVLFPDNPPTEPDSQSSSG